MTPEQFVAILGALAVLVGAVGALWKAINSYHHEVDGRITELIELTRRSSRAEGRLEASQDRPLNPI